MKLLRPAATKRIPLESEIQRAFFVWRDFYRKRHPVLNAIFAVPNGIWTHKAIAVKQRSQGLTGGIPDVICLAPSACGQFHALLLEFKREKTGRLSPEQKYFVEFFRSIGNRVEIVTSSAAAIDHVCDHLNLAGLR